MGDGRAWVLGGGGYLDLLSQSLGFWFLGLEDIGGVWGLGICVLGPRGSLKLLTWPVTLPIIIEATS